MENFYKVTKYQDSNVPSEQIFGRVLHEDEVMQGGIRATKTDCGRSRGLLEDYHWSLEIF